jgi:hypothetical protein
MNLEHLNSSRIQHDDHALPLPSALPPLLSKIKMYNV